MNSGRNRLGLHSSFIIPHSSFPLAGPTTIFMPSYAQKESPMKLHLPCAALLALLIAGCGSHDVAPTPAQSDQYAPQQIGFSGEDDLRDHLAFQPITRTFDNSGLLHIIVPVRNTIDQDVTVDYKVTWMDDRHSPVDTATAWQTKTLHSNIFEYIEATSTSPRARDFQID